MTPDLPTLSGPIPVLPTMFGDDKLALREQARLCERIVSAGLTTLVTGGLEGEGATLTQDELIAATTIAAEAGARVGASVCLPGTEAACEAARTVASAGASFLVVSPPPYNRPTLEGVYAHLARIGETARLPIVLRDDPARTRVLLSDEFVARLCRSGVVSAIVLPPGDMRASRRIDVLSHGDVQSVAGSDFDAILQQCDDRAAWLSTAAVVDPARCRDLHAARMRDDWRSAARLSRELCRLMRALETDEAAVTLKAAIGMIGLGRGDLRLPLVAASDASRQTIANALAALDFATAPPDRPPRCSAA